MRSVNLIHLLGAVAVAAIPVVASAAPLRAGAALPKMSIADADVARRAAAPVDHESDLIGLPVLGFVGLFVAVVVIVVAASGGGSRSPG